MLVADAVARTLSELATPVLGLATGRSPLAAYRDLIRRRQSGELSFAHARIFLLDEYVGLPPDHPQTYRSFIRRELTDHIDLPDGSLHVPAGNADSLNDACDEFELAMRAAGGVDLQVLGIGRNGHIGFNEPGSGFTSRTRPTTLTDVTRQDNSHFFGGDIRSVPRQALTQGIATIMEARCLILIATGTRKAAAISAAVEGQVTTEVPASVIQTHPHATAILDQDAAAELKNPGRGGRWIRARRTTPS